MIKAKLRGYNGDREALVLGLSGENVTRLAAGEPISAALEEVGFPGVDLVVVYGKTEEDVLRDIRRIGAGPKPS